MIQDLNEVYDEAGVNGDSGEQTPKPPKISASAGYLNWRSSAPQSMARAGNSFHVDNVTPSDQDKFFANTGIYDPALTGQDISQEAGERQTGWNKLGRRLVNLVPNAIGSAVDVLGNVGALISEWGDDRDYRNGLNDLADAIKNPAGQNYARSNDTWAITDPTWWIDNAANMAEMALGFTAAGKVIATGLVGAAERIAGAVGASARTSKWLTTAAQMGTSAVSSYAEAAQAGAQVYTSVYDTQLQKALADGLSPDDAADKAKHIAAQSAATASQLGTVLTMGINVGAYTPWFKSAENAGMDIIAARIAKSEAAGLSAAEMATAIRGLNVQDFADKLFHHSTVVDKLREMVGEGAEEVLQNFAQQTGQDLGDDSKTKGLFAQIGELENIVDKSANSQNLLAFTLGAGFGGLQHVLIHNTPNMRVDKYTADGKPIQKMGDDGPMVDKNGVPVMEKTWVSPRTSEHDFTKRKFDTLKETVAYDFQNFHDTQNQILEGIAEKNDMKVAEARDQLFDTGKLYAIKADLAEPWKKTFTKIVNMPVEEAVAAGYASDVNDESYKDKAQQSITDIDHLSGLYQTLQSKYGTDERITPYVDMVFGRQVDLYSTGKRIDEYRKKLDINEAEEAKMLKGIDPANFSSALNDFHRTLLASQVVEKQLMDDHKVLMSGDPKVVDKLLRKYRAIGMGDGDRTIPVQDLDRKLKTKQSQLQDKIKLQESSLLSSVEYTTWLQDHPDGTFNGFLKEINARNNMLVQNRYARTQLDMAQAQYEIAQSNLSEMTKDKSVNKFSRKVEEWKQQMAAEAKASEESRSQQIASLVKDKGTLSRLQKLNLHTIAEKYKTERDNVYGKIATNQNTIEDIKEQLKGKNVVRDIFNAGGLRAQMKRAVKENAVLTKWAEKLDTLYKEHAVDMEDEEPVTVDEVTAADTGVTTDTTTTETTEPETTAPVAAPVIPGVPVTVADEMEAMAREIEEAVQPGTEYDPHKAYGDLFQKQPKGIRVAMDQLVGGMLDGTIGFSLDYLNRMINPVNFTQADAIQLLSAAKDFVDEIKRMQAIQTGGTEVSQESQIEEPIQIIVSGIEPPDTPPITDTIDAPTPESNLYHAGYKIVEAATTGATSTIEYHEGVNDKGTAFIKVQRKDAINRDVSEDIMHPGKILPGTELEFVVDTEYDGPKLITDDINWEANITNIREKEKGTDYLDKNGNALSHPRMVGNIPIKVMDKATGKTLFYIRKLDWLEAKFPGTDDYRNVVEWTGTEEARINNLDLQRERLMDIRSRIVNRYNANRQSSVGKISAEGKGTGRMILNHVIEEKSADTGKIKSSVVPEFAYNKKDPTRSLLPEDGTLSIAGDGGALLDGANHSFDKETDFDRSTIVKGAVGQMVRAVNGKYMWASLVGVKNAEPGKPSPALNTITRVIELYLLNDGTDQQITGEIDGLQSNTGFNVATAQGLRAFINQYYTYLQGFQDSALLANSGNTTEQFLFNVNDKLSNVADKTKQIKAGFSLRGDGVQYANLLNGALHPEFVKVLQEGLQTRPHAVVFTNPTLGLRGINSSGTFTDAVYVPSKGWKHEQYDSYNQYVKSFSRTSVYGRNQLSDGTYVYTANPSLPMDFQNLEHETALVVEDNTTATKVDLPEIDEDTENRKLFESLTGLGNLTYSMPAQSSANQIGTGSEKSKPLNLQTLQEMYNFTSEAERNGKTPLEVFDDLSKRGHTYLSEGYNPFSRCL